MSTVSKLCVGLNFYYTIGSIGNTNVSAPHVRTTGQRQVRPGRQFLASHDIHGVHPSRTIRKWLSLQAPHRRHAPRGPRGAIVCPLHLYSDGRQRYHSFNFTIVSRGVNDGRHPVDSFLFSQSESLADVLLSQPQRPHRTERKHFPTRQVFNFSEQGSKFV